MKTLDRKLLRDLLSMKGQVIAIALVCACGIAAFVMSLTTLASLEGTQANYYQKQRFARVFARLKRAPLALADRIAEIPGVGRVETRVVMEVTLDVPGMEEPVSGRLISLPGRHGTGLNVPYLRRGRLPDSERLGEVLVSDAFAKARQLRPGDSLRAVINGRMRALRVAGTALSPEYIYEIRPGELLPDNQRFGVIWMNGGELAQTAGMDGAFNDVSLTLLRGAVEREVTRRLDLLLAPWGGLGAHGRDDQISHRMVSDEIRQLQGMAAVVPPIFLLVSAFLLNIVLSRIIATQREQTAAIRAFGYSSREIARHYALLAVVITLLGVALGCMAGAWLGKGLTVMYVKFFQFPVIRYQFDAWVPLLASAIALAASLAGVASAVRRAARLPPAEAMRPEAPANFRSCPAGGAGRLRHLGQGGRMVVRNLARQPWRTAMNVTGISLAVAVLILGTFTEDVVNEVMDRQFQWAQRQDYTLTLAEPASLPVLEELRQLPGIRRAEPFRAVQVRIHSGPRWRQAGLTGYSPERRIHPLLDMDLQPVPLDEHGLALSEKLGELLRARPGDTVRVEVLEGRRPVREMTVRSLTRDTSGFSASMELDGVFELLGEGPTLSGAFVSLDPSLSARFHKAVKNTPRIAAVTSKDAMLESFRNTMAENLLRMKLFNVLFAGIIAFGVVYNNARIAVAERGREFATLRVLGFTRAEVSRLMLVEVVAVTAAGLPVGLILGRVFAAGTLRGLETESLRLPLVIHASTYAFAVAVITVAAVFSGLVVRRKLDKLDLIGVLKARD